MYVHIIAGAPDQMMKLALGLGLGSSGHNTGAFVGNFSTGRKRSTYGATGTRICYSGMCASKNIYCNYII